VCRPRLPGHRTPACVLARHRPRALRGGRRRAGPAGVQGGGAPGGDHPGARDGARARVGARAGRRRARPGVPVRAGRQGSSGGAGGRAGVSATPANGLRRIADAFAAASGRAALMPYLMAGFPTLEESIGIGQACVLGGADLLELGVPYSDPLADGPVIHEAGTRALAAGATVSGVLEVARALAPSIPVVLMCYSNIVFAAGAQAFVERLARAGACGLIVPDLPLEEASGLREMCDSQGLALVPLVAPTTTPERLAAIGASAR